MRHAIVIVLLISSSATAETAGQAPDPAAWSVAVRGGLAALELYGGNGLGAALELEGGYFLRRDLAVAVAIGATSRMSYAGDGDAVDVFEDIPQFSTRMATAVGFVEYRTRSVNAGAGIGAIREHTDVELAGETMLETGPRVETVHERIDRIGGILAVRAGLAYRWLELSASASLLQLAPTRSSVDGEIRSHRGVLGAVALGVRWR